MPISETWLLPDGVADVLPEQAQVIETMRREALDFLASRGYQLVYTPFIEYIESLSSLSESNQDLDLPTFKVIDQLEVKNVVITGMMTHMCVDATTRAAVELGYHTTVISDATATRDLSFAEQMTSASQVQTALLSAFQMITTVHSVVDYLSIYESNTR